MIKMQRILTVAVAVLLVAASAWAQGWRGQGRMAGKVTDESGAPLDGVVVKCYLPSASGGTEAKTNKKGEWSLGGVAGGTWQLDFSKAGYETRQISVAVQELTRIPTIEIVLKKAAPDANQVIAAELQKASALVKEKKFAEAQAVYSDLLLKYPQAYQLELQIARAYDLEGAYDKEIEHLKKYLERDPGNVGIKLLTGGMMIARGNADEGKALLATVDDAQITEPAVLLNVGIDLLNKKKPNDAMDFFNRTITRFPEYPDAYYYRGVTELSLSAQLSEDKPASAKMLEAGKADLTKFLAMAPNAPEAEAAKKMLDQLK